MLKVMSYYEKIDLNTLNWDIPVEKALNFDSLERTALLTCIENNFNTVFDDNVFLNLKSLNDIK